MAGWPSRCEDRSRSLSRDEHMPSVRRLLAFRRSVPRVSSSEEGGMLMRIGMRLGPFGVSTSTRRRGYRRPPPGRDGPVLLGVAVAAGEKCSAL